MKNLLILCLIYWATVSANTESFRTTDNKKENRDKFAQNQITYPGDISTRISKTDLETKNILSSHLLFDSFKSQYPLLLFDVSIDPEYNFYLLNPQQIAYQENRITNLLTSAYINHSLFSSMDHFSEKNNIIICWNRFILTDYMNIKLSNINSPNHLESNQNSIDEKYFTYAGTKRFTITGDPPNISTEIQPFRASLVGLVSVVTAIAMHNNQSAAWWDGKGRTFYIKEDWNNALFADKFGHFMGGYFTAYIAREAFVFSGCSWDQSILLGSALGLVTQTYIEFKDGYAENTGFSPSDFAADLAGVTYFYLQNYIPLLQNFTPKWQYTPPGLIGVSPQTRTQTFLDNYNSTTGWISVHIKNLFWGKEESFWPKWLNVGIGYGVSGYHTPDIYSRFVIGLDYNLVELLPDGFPFWNWLKQTFNYIKLPAPAIEFSKQGIKFRVLYPFTFSTESTQF